MTKQEFAAEFERLLAAYPYFKPDKPEAVTRLWHEKLQRFPTHDVHTVFDEIIDAAEEFLPHVGKVAERCKVLEDKRRAERISKRIAACKKCDATGWINIEKDGVRRVMRCKCAIGSEG